MDSETIKIVPQFNARMGKMGEKRGKSSYADISKFCNYVFILYNSCYIIYHFEY